jgi:hypothetical protein
MTPELYSWFARWGIPPQAVAEYRQIVGIDTDPAVQTYPANSEAAVQQTVRLNISRSGGRVWRNNSGAVTYIDEKGVTRHLRYGLCNDSPKLNKQIKSSDLIGITPVVIPPEYVGRTVGVFTALEIKAPGWKFSPNDAREKAQLKFIELVVSMGGIGKFISEV